MGAGPWAGHMSLLGGHRHKQTAPQAGRCAKSAAAVLCRRGHEAVRRVCCCVGTDQDSAQTRVSHEHLLPGTSLCCALMTPLRCQHRRTTRPVPAEVELAAAAQSSGRQLQEEQSTRGHFRWDCWSQGPSFHQPPGLPAVWGRAGLPETVFSEEG